MELYCSEKFLDNQKAERDPVIFDDMRVLYNLLDIEAQFVPPCNYFQTVQNDIQPFMRKVVATWMLEVCEEQMCEGQVFPLSVNFLDRFLCVCSISRRQLQLAGAVCLLLAGKIRQCHALSVDLLCAYTDNSITPADMREWELLVLSKLRWNAAGVTPHDVAEHVLARLPRVRPLAPAPAPERLPALLRLHPLTRQHALTLVGFCCIESEFIQSRPSLLAAAAICAAIRFLHGSAEAPVLAATVGAVCALTRSELEAVSPIVEHIECALAADVSNQEQLASPPTPLIAAAAPAAPAPAAAAASAKVAAATVPALAEEARQPETPTDIQDVLF